MYFPKNETYDVTGLTNGMYQEVLTILEAELNFTTRQFKRQDAVWGSITVDNSTGTLISTGMLAGVLSGNADLIDTSLGVQSARSLVIDYLPPISYNYVGLAIRNDETLDDLDLATYLHPFSNQLWLAIVTLAFCISIFLYLFKFIITGNNYKTVCSAKNMCSSTKHEFIF
jgi:hypothetical protein